MLQPGDEIVFSTGEFDLGDGLDVTVQGEAGNRIVLRGSTRADGAQTVLKTQTAASTLRLEGGYFIVTDIQIQGPGAALVLNGTDMTVRDSMLSGARTAIDCESCVRTEIRNNDFFDLTDLGSAAIRASSFVDGTIRDNWIHQVSGHGILVESAVNAQIVDNVIEDAAADGIQISFPSDEATGQQNLVAGNFVRRVGRNAVTTTGATSVVNNILLTFAENGVHATLGVAASDVASLVAHNTIRGSTTCFRGTQWSSSNAGGALANNALYCEPGTAIVFDDGVGATTQVVRNVYLGAADSPADSVVGSSLADFQNAGRNNYYPSEDSVLIDAGDANFAVAEDFDGASRDETPDVGAYEYVGAQPSGPIPGNGFKGELNDPDPSLGGDIGADAGDAGGGGGPGSAQGGTTSDFPDREGCSCSSARTSSALIPLFALIVVGAARRRRR